MAFFCESCKSPTIHVHTLGCAKLPKGGIKCAGCGSTELRKPGLVSSLIHAPDCLWMLERLRETDVTDPSGARLHQKIVNTGVEDSPQKAFIAGVSWLCDHLEEAAVRKSTDIRDTIEKKPEPGMPGETKTYEVVTKAGHPYFASQLRSLAAALMAAAPYEAEKRYPQS